MTDLQLIENALYSYIPEKNGLYDCLIDSMEYSLSAGVLPYVRRR